MHIDITKSDVASAQTFCDAEYPGCAHFTVALAAFKAAGHALAGAFAADEAAWQAEDAKQKALCAEASRLASE